MLQWLHDHPWILAWCVLGVASDALASALPAGRTQQAVRVLAHLSPGAVLSAARAARAVLVGGVLVVTLSMLACSPAPVIQNAAVAADVAAYAAEQEDCVTGSATLEAARNCVTRVRARWCAPGAQLQQVGGCGLDGGTTTAVAARPVDAGGP